MDFIDYILRPFIEEILPQGGIDMSKSRWQKPGRGYGGRYPDHPDVRYIAALIKLLYQVSDITGNDLYSQLANRQVRFIANFASEKDPMWLLGTALQAIGMYFRYNSPNESLREAAWRIIKWARQKKVEITIGEETYGHFPCGYGLMDAKDAGWTNDLSIMGSGLVFGYEVTGDKKVLDEAISYAEFFVRPWEQGQLGDDGYWHSGTWRDDIGSWVIGPLHYSGVEGTNGYTDEISWVFSSFSCIDYLAHLYSYNPDQRYKDCCVNAAKWTFKNCQFDDGAIGLCEKDDKWLGCTGYAISQIYLIKHLADDDEVLQYLLACSKSAYKYLRSQLSNVDYDCNGVEWVSHKTLADPMVNVGWLWLDTLQGLIDGEKLLCPI